LAWVYACDSKREAMQKEAAIKRLCKADKEALIKTGQEGNSRQMQPSV
jgi:predicted GIY-YIG superfamily endonuclease